MSHSVNTLPASWILVKHMTMCVLFDRRRKTPPRPFQYWRTSHFCVDNDPANHNQEPNGLFRQSEEPAAVPGYLRLRGRLGIPPPTWPGPSSCALLLRLWMQRTWPGTVKEIQSSEKALIHHTSLAACHLNAKYLHCIFKSKQEKK